MLRITDRLAENLIQEVMEKDGIENLNNQLKVFKYGLFYFKCDKTVSIVKLSNISKVLSGTNTKPGSVILVKYGTLKEPLEAKIIAVECEF